MSNVLIHSMDSAWISTSPALSVGIDDQLVVEGVASNLLASPGGALGESVHYEPPAPLDLRLFDELRFWVRADRVADGSLEAPFYLEISYQDANDAAGEEHRWFVPINQRQLWEHRRIGMETDRRGAISSFRFRCLTNQDFSCRVDEFLAVREEMLTDLESALVTLLTSGMQLPGLSNLPLQQAAPPGTTQVILALNRHLYPANRIVIRDGASGEEAHDLGAVTHNPGNGTTTLALTAGDQVQGNFTLPGSTVSVSVPALIETPPAPTPSSSPALVLTPLGPREDLGRSPVMTQRDSFRPGAQGVVSSIRPGPRAYLVDYQVVVAAPERGQHQAIMDALLRRASIDGGLRINGVPSPVAMTPAPALFGRAEGTLGPVYLRIGTRMEITPRRVVPAVSSVDIIAAPPDMPADHEDIRLTI